MSDAPSLWDLRRRGVVRAQHRLRDKNESGLHDLRVALRRVAATADALGRDNLGRRARRIASSLSDDRQLEIDRALLARVGALGLLSEEGTTALAARWENGRREMIDEADDRVRRVARRLRSLARSEESIDLRRLEQSRAKAETALTALPEKADDRTLHRFRLNLKRARYLAEDLVACGRAELTPAVEREKKVQDALGRWNDVRLFQERVDHERKLAEARGAVRLASELEGLRVSLTGPLASLRREAVDAVRRLTADSPAAARSA